MRARSCSVGAPALAGHDEHRVTVAMTVKKIANDFLPVMDHLTRRSRWRSWPAALTPSGERREADNATVPDRRAGWQYCKETLIHLWSHGIIGGRAGMTHARFPEETFTKEPGGIAKATPVMPSVRGSSIPPSRR